MATRDELVELVFTLQNYPEELKVANVERILLDSARKNDKRGAKITVEVPDDLVQSLKGSRKDLRDLVLLVRIPAEMRERARSPIVTPAERRGDDRPLIVRG